jgi:hypothetical protein
LKQGLHATSHQIVIICDQNTKRFHVCPTLLDSKCAEVSNRI